MSQQMRRQPTLAEESAPARRAQSFEEYFGAERARLYRSLYLVTGNASEAEELTQEALVRVWEQWDRVSKMDQPTGYLYRTAMNLFRSRTRAARRAARKMFVSRLPEDSFALVDARDTVARALGLLTTRQRAALVLTELLEFTSKEAAEMLGVKPATIRSLASRARSAIRETLEDADE